MSDSKNQFFFQGKWFHNQEDMFAYVKEWQNLTLDQETAERILKDFSKEMMMNIFLRGVEFTNLEFTSFLSDLFLFYNERMICGKVHHE